MKTKYKNKWNSNDWKNVLDSNVPFNPKIGRLEMRSDEFRHVRCIIPEHCFNDKYFEKYNGIEYDLYNKFNLICVFEYVNDVFEKGTMKSILQIVNLMIKEERVQNILKKFNLTTEQFGNMYQFGKVDVQIKQKTFIFKNEDVKDLPGPFVYQGSKIDFSTKTFNSFVKGKMKGKKFDNYYEPFLGSGSLAMHAMNNKIAKNYYLSDINPFLIDVWKNIKSPDSYNIIYDTIEGFYKQIYNYNFDCNNSEDRMKALNIYHNFMKEANNSNDILFKISANLIWMSNKISAQRYFDKNGVINCTTNDNQLTGTILLSYEKQFKNGGEDGSKFKSQLINRWTNQFKNLDKSKKDHISNRLVNTHNLVKDNNVHIDCKDYFDVLDNINSDEKNLIFLDPEYHNSKGKYGFDWNNNDLDDLVNKIIELSKNKNNSILMTNIYEEDYSNKLIIFKEDNNFNYFVTNNKIGVNQKSREDNNKHESCLSKNL